MKKYEVRPRRTLVDITCDICGKSCKTKLDDFEYATLSASWGYCSRKDGESYSALLCEDCFDDVVKNINALRQQKRESETNE